MALPSATSQTSRSSIPGASRVSASRKQRTGAEVAEAPVQQAEHLPVHPSSNGGAATTRGTSVRRDLSGAVGGMVVDHDELVVGSNLRENRSQSRCENERFVASGDDHRARWPVLVARPRQG